NRKVKLSNLFKEAIKEAKLDSKLRQEEIEKIKGNSNRNQDQNLNEHITETEVYMIKFKAPKMVKKADIELFFSPIKLKNIEIPWQGKSENPGMVDIQFYTQYDQNSAQKKDGRYLLDQKIKLIAYTKKYHNSKEKPDYLSKDLENDIAETGKIFFRNLPFSAKENEVKELFEKYGPLSEFKMETNFSEKNVTNKGYGVCTFMFPEHALKAFNEADGTCFQGRIIHIIPGRHKDEEIDNLKTGADDLRDNFKKNKDLGLKKEAQKSYNWNTFFFNSDSTKVGLGATIALAEAQIVRDAQKYLENNGVNIGSFKSNYSRCRQKIIIKNLPLEIEEQEIKKLFSAPGQNITILRPPNCTSCLAVYQDSKSAEHFFKKMSYYKMSNGPLYLEWAPEDVIAHNKNLTKPKETIDNPNNRVLVKGLYKNINEEQLKNLFEEFGSPQVSLARDKQTGANISSALVSFSSAKDCTEAIKKLQGSELRENKLEIVKLKKESENSLKVIRKEQKEQNIENIDQRTKLIVKNLPFQASKNDLKILFKPFGEIDYIRLPIKPHSFSNSEPGHRGFGFVNFKTAMDAKKAKNALSLSTHLFGRRLIIEWADESGSDSIEVARKKARYFENVQDRDFAENIKKELNS
ncbi:MAG: putative RNA-binding protein 19, partial [Paramarteilia canceri]